MTHRELVAEINQVLEPIDLKFEKVRPEGTQSVMLLSRGPRFDDNRSDSDLVTLIRKRLDEKPQVAEAVKDLAISLT